MKKILITGANSYIGMNFAKYAEAFYSTELTTEAISLRENSWKDKNFGEYDVVLHVAGIAHVDLGDHDEEIRKKYISVNTDLAVETCKKAKREGVKQFVFMSSSCVYGDNNIFINKRVITEQTTPDPDSYYGESKLLAEEGLMALTDESFTVTIIRTPMVYGKGSKGNYPVLAKLALKTPVFPAFNNERSMIYIENLTEFLSQITLKCRGGIFWPQNAEYTGTSDLVRKVSRIHGHKILITGLFNWAIYATACFPGKIGRLTRKAFGSLCYERSMSVYDFDYCVVGFEESIKRTENTSSF